MLSPFKNLRIRWPFSLSPLFSFFFSPDPSGPRLRRPSNPFELPLPSAALGSQSSAFRSPPSPRPIWACLPFAAIHHRLPSFGAPALLVRRHSRSVDRSSVCYSSDLLRGLSSPPIRVYSEFLRLPLLEALTLDIGCNQLASCSPSFGFARRTLVCHCSSSLAGSHLSLAYDSSFFPLAIACACSPLLRVRPNLPSFGTCPSWLVGPPLVIVSFG